MIMWIMDGVCIKMLYKINFAYWVLFFNMFAISYKNKVFISHLADHWQNANITKPTNHDNDNTNDSNDNKESNNMTTNFVAKVIYQAHTSIN